MFFFNPFGELKETLRYPHARSHRTTLGQKMWDTFKVFFGDFSFYDNSVHLGLFDYCTLFIFFFLTVVAFCGIRDTRTVLDGIITGVSLLILALLLLPRLVIAAFLTLVCFPFVCIAHSIFSGEGDSLKVKISSHKIQEGTTTHTLGDLLERNKTPLENIDIARTKKAFLDPNKQSFYIGFFNPCNRKDVVNVVLNLRDANHKKVYKAMSKLNIADLQGANEREEIPVETNIFPK